MKIIRQFYIYEVIVFNIQIWYLWTQAINVFSFLHQHSLNQFFFLPKASIASIVVFRYIQFKVKVFKCNILVDMLDFLRDVPNHFSRTHSALLVFWIYFRGGGGSLSTFFDRLLKASMLFYKWCIKLYNETTKWGTILPKNICYHICSKIDLSITNDFFLLRGLNVTTFFLVVY